MDQADFLSFCFDWIEDIINIISKIRLVLVLVAVLNLNLDKDTSTLMSKQVYTVYHENVFSYI